jgi:ketosteroid isomerase-like protein
MSHMPEDTEQRLRKAVEEWAAAELRADTGFLERTLADDFIGIGPRGFMLSKEEWLQRHTSGDLKYESLSLDDVKVRVYGDAAIVTGSESQRAKYRDQDVPGQFRTTLVWVKQSGSWLLAGLQLSPIAGPPAGGSPGS